MFNRKCRDKACIKFAGEVKGHSDLSKISQCPACSESALHYKPIRALLAEANIHAIGKPLGVFELEMAIHSLVQKVDVDAVEDAISILLYNKSSGHDVNEILSRFAFMLTEIDDHKQLSKIGELQNIDAVIIVASGEDGELQVISALREAELDAGRSFYLPVIVVGDPAHEINAYQQGADHFLLYSSPNALFEESVRFWARVTRQNSEV